MTILICVLVGCLAYFNVWALKVSDGIRLPLWFEVVFYLAFGAAFGGMLK